MVPTSGPAAGGLSLGVLGGVWAELDGQRLALGGPRQRAVLAALIAARGAVLTLDQLVDAVWEDDPPAAAVGTVQTYISNLRRVLEPGRAARDVSRVVVSAAPGYVLRIDPDAVDAWRFERLVLTAAEHHNADQRRNQLADALAIWTGEPFAGAAASGSLAAEVTRLRQLRWSALEQLSASLLAVGAADEAQQCTRLVTVEAPLREEAWRLLALALYVSGRAGDGLATLRQARQVLGDELGIDPGPELQRLEQQMLNREVPMPFAGAPAASPVRCALSGSSGPAAAPANPAPRVTDLEAPADHTVVGAGNATMNAAQVIGAPVQLRPLIGRDAEVDSLTSLLARSRLITVTGPGGSGKTRLALAAAEATAARFADGASFATLQTLSDLAAVWSLLAQRFHADSTAPDVAAAVVHAIGDRRLLLVLDNLEHLDGVDAVVARLLAAPNLHVLATSRRPLLLSGEQEFALDVLPLPDGDTVAAVEGSEAGRFFVACARSARPGFVLDESAAPAVAALCRRLDGLPLALELAAAQLRFFSPSALVAHLTQQLSVNLGLGLTAGDRPERHRTLGAAIAYSHDLLSDEDQVVFRRLAVFAGPVPMDAIMLVTSTVAKPMAAPVTDVFGSVTRLTLAGLVRVDPAAGTPRFGMLDTIHDYATDQLRRSGEERDLRRQHLRWCRDVLVPAFDAETYRGEFERLAVINELIDEVRGALHFAFGEAVPAPATEAATEDLRRIETVAADMLIAAATPWTLVGGGAEIQGWLDRAMVAVPLESDPGRHLDLAHQRTIWALLHRDAEPPVAELRRLLPLIPPTEELVAARVNLTLGAALLNVGDAEQAMHHFLRAAHHADAVAACGIAALARVSVHAAASTCGRLDVAETVTRELLASITQDRVAPDPKYFIAIGVTDAALGRFADAATHLERALADFRSSKLFERFDVRAQVMLAARELAMLLDRPADGARLLGWWLNCCVAIGIAPDVESVPSMWSGPNQPTTAALRERLGADEWARVTAEGAEMTIEQCLEVLDDMVADAARRGEHDVHHRDGSQRSTPADHR